MAIPVLPLFDATCECGAQVQKAGLCLRCYQRRRRSIKYFGGYREGAHERCRLCGGNHHIGVHHRTGIQDPILMIAVCAGCHARIHRLKAHARWLQDALIPLWKEQHPEQPEQIQITAFAA